MRSKWIRQTGYCNYKITDCELWELKNAVKGWNGEYKAVIRLCSVFPVRCELVVYKKEKC